MGDFPPTAAVRREDFSLQRDACVRAYSETVNCVFLSAILSVPITP